MSLSIRKTHGRDRKRREAEGAPTGRTETRRAIEVYIQLKSLRFVSSIEDSNKSFPAVYG